MGPSTLLPSHDQTTFHDCPAASTPGIAEVTGRSGSGGAAFADGLMGMENGFGGFLHFASTALIPGFCQLCMLLPRGNEDDGLCAETPTAAQPTINARATFDFIP